MSLKQDLGGDESEPNYDRQLAGETTVQDAKRFEESDAEIAFRQKIAEQRAPTDASFGPG